MAGAGTPIPSGGKRAVDFNLNMVPFIDLLSVLLAFLLVSAVWGPNTQLDVTTGAETNTPGEAVEPGPRATLTIARSGYRWAFASEGGHLDRAGDGWDREGLRRSLAQLRFEHPGLREVVVAAEDQVPYEELIAAMDLCLSLGLDGLSVSGVDP
jgi:biopolymer transport protein TolR